MIRVKCGFEDFTIHYVERKSNKGKQVYGGLGILVRNNLRKGVKHLPLTCSDYQWLKLDKNFFGFDSDIYLCFAYIPPQQFVPYLGRSSFLSMLTT